MGSHRAWRICLVAVLGGGIIGYVAWAACPTAPAEARLRIDHIVGVSNETSFDFDDDCTQDLDFSTDGTSVDINSPTLPGTFTGAWTFGDSGTALTVTNDAQMGYLGLGTAPTSSSTGLVMSYSWAPSVAGNQYGIDAAIANASTYTTGVGSVTGARFITTLTSTTAAQRSSTIGGLFYGRVNSNTTFSSSLTDIIGGEFIADGVNTKTATVNQMFGGRFAVDVEELTASEGVALEIGSSNSGNPPVEVGSGAVTTMAGIRVHDMTNQGSPTNIYGIYLEAQDGTNQGAAAGNLNLAGGNWNTGHLQMENGHVWYDVTNDVTRVSKDADGSVPTAEDDGFPVPLSHAEIYANDANLEHTISSSGQANKVQITSFDTNGQSFLDTPDHTNDHITILDSGIYMVMVSMTLESVAGSDAKFGYSVYINNGATELPGMSGARDLPAGGGKSGSISMSGLASFTASDTVEVWIWNETNTQNVVVDDINLSVVRIK